MLQVVTISVVHTFLCAIKNIALFRRLLQLSMANSHLFLYFLSADVLFENCFIVSRFLDYYELSMLIIVIIVVMCNV